MAQKQFKIGLSNTDKQNMAQDVYERVLALTFNEYDTTTEYEVGDFVVYNNQLYKCIGATSGAWDSSKWQLATLNDLVDDIENAVQFVNDKANVDGNYPTMTVGAADNLTPYDEDSGTDQEQPFLLQGTGCGNGEQQVDTGALGLLKSKNGHSVVVNQIIPSFSEWGSVGSATKTISGGVMTITTVASGQSGFSSGDIPFKEGHKYIRFLSLKGEVGVTYNFNTQFDSITGNGDWQNLKNVVTAVSSSNNYLVVYTNDVASTFQVKDCYYIDLTQWFGSNDNIPTHLLAHPEDFFRYYQGSLAYNEGTLVNANGRYLKAIGRNQWNEEWELGSIDTSTGQNTSSSSLIRSKNYISVIPNTDYYLRKGSVINVGMAVYYYDKDKNFIEFVDDVNNNVKTIPSNCCFIRFIASGSTYNNDITISLYYEGESGHDQYYPYEELANIDTGTETLRSAGSVKDIKLPSGEIKRNVGVVDLGTLSWTYDNAGYYYAAFASIKTATKNVKTTKYLTSNISVSNPSCPSETIEVGTQMIFVKTSVEPTGTLYYELAEPTTEQGTTFSENVAIDDFGSMDFGGTNNVPQGASIFYAVDYKAFIDSLYNTLDGDATDIVKESELDSKLATLGYVKLTSVSGYDATKTQVLKNVEGTLTWVTEE